MSILVGWSLQTILLALVEEGFAADAEGYGGAADLVMRGFEGGGNDFALHFLEGAKAGDRAGGAGRCGANIFRKISGLEQVTLGRGSTEAGTRENDRVFESI